MGNGFDDKDILNSYSYFYKTHEGPECVNIKGLPELTWKYVYSDEARYDLEPLILIEELSELIKAVTKYIRKPTANNKNSIAEEMADVLITVEMNRIMWGISPELISDWSAYKTVRDGCAKMDDDEFDKLKKKLHIEE